ncbi:MAG: protein kinase [Deltaproteobacteria bacterium]|nr:protein kinase [Deltaproteobacteria bacterium]
MSSEQFPTLGRYQVIDKIATGGMAEVFLAKAVGAMGFERLVAIKLIHSNFTRDEEFVKMFIDEARIAMHLHHRNIVQVFDLDKVGDTYFIAMEYVHGVNIYSLYERIAAKGRWIDPSMALYIAAEVSKGLHFAHTRTSPEGRPLNIIHRDISPQNVLLSFEGEVKITDFGIATAAERLHQTAAGIVKGKYAYMAPERLQERPVDARVDVFSVGVLLYEMLAGENPFAGASPVETIESVLQKKVPAPSERGARISRQLDSICLRALAKEPRQRFATSHAMADAMTEYALELTQARKDMATGDAALASLLAELFPEAAKGPLSTRPARDRDLRIPGIGDPSDTDGDDTTRKAEPAAPRPHDTHPDPADTPAAAMETEQERAHGIESYRTPTDVDEFDAPTVLKLTPMHHHHPAVRAESNRARLITRDADAAQASQDAKRESEARAAPNARLGVTANGRGPTSGRSRQEPPHELLETLPPGPSSFAQEHPSHAGNEEPDTTAPTRMLSDVDDPADPTIKASAVSAPGARTLRPPVDDPLAATVPSDDLATALSPEGASAASPSPSPSASASAAAAAAAEFRDARPQPNPVRPIRQVSGPGNVESAPSVPAPISHNAARRMSPSGDLPYLGDGRLVVPVKNGSGDILPPDGGAGSRNYRGNGGSARAQRAPNLNLIAGVSLLLAAIMVAAAALLVLSRNRGPANPPAKSTARVAGAETVRLRVTSEPEGALLIVNGRDQVERTPTTIQVEPNRTYYLELELDGFEPIKRTFETAGDAEEATEHFKMFALLGSVTIIPTPKEAKVFVNDTPRGQGTVTVGGLAVGEKVRVRVAREGYQPYEVNLDLSPSQLNLVVPVTLIAR